MNQKTLRDDAMNREAISQIVFDEHYAVPVDQETRQLFRHLPSATNNCSHLVDAMPTAYLIAVLESICLREMHRHIDADHETVVGSAIDCRHCAPVPAGALLRVSGWVERVVDGEATFRMLAQDEHERVCEATIRIAIVRRDQILPRITHKKEAIERRQLFLAFVGGIARARPDGRVDSKPQPCTSTQSTLPKHASNQSTGRPNTPFWSSWTVGSPFAPAPGTHASLA